VAVVAALVMVACGSSEGANDAPVSSVPDSATDDTPVIDLGPGTAIADGFVVPEGADLLLPPLPSGGSTWQGIAPDVTWHARLRAWQPVVAFAGLVAQAATAGFELTSLGGPGGAGCTASVDPPGEAEGALVPVEDLTASDDLAAVYCAANGRRTIDGHEEQISLVTELADGGGGPVASGSVRFQRWPAGVVPTTFGDPLVEPEPVVLPFGPADAVPGLGPGELIDDSRGEARLVAGSRLVAPVETGICQGGFAAVVEVTGDPDAVFDGYARQIRAWVEPYGLPYGEGTAELFGRSVREARGTGDDSSSFTATMVSAEGEQPRLLFELCGG
jgi:hypothetical protein